MNKEIAAQLKRDIIEGKRKSAPDLANTLLKSGVKAYDIVTLVCAPAMSEVGTLYQQGEYFVPELLMSGKAFEAVMEVLRPNLKESERKATGTIVIGVCEGDIHTIGKDLVVTMLEAAGFNVIDLGSDVPTIRFIESAKESKADIIGISALMTTSMTGMRTIIDAAKAADLGAKIMIGGGPVTDEYARKIGANAYGRDAREAVDIAIELMKL